MPEKTKEIKYLYTVMYKNEEKKWVNEPLFHPATTYKHALYDLKRAKDTWKMYKWKIQKWVRW